MFNKDLINFNSKVPVNIQVFELSNGKYTVENEKEIEDLRKENRRNYYEGKLTTKEYLKRQYEIINKIKIEEVVLFSSETLPF